jgi:hypothetical protein
VRTYITQDQLATLFQVSKKTIQNRLSRAPQSLPPCVRLPGAKAPIWDPVVVEKWQDSVANGLVPTPTNTQTPIASEALSQAASSAVKRKRGRPSNAERAARGELQ